MEILKSLAGFRDVQVFVGVTSGTVTSASQYIEVTNNGSTDVSIYLNDYPDQGHPTKGMSNKGIPIKAGVTREIPMYVYNFTATGPVTVVAYTM